MRRLFWAVALAACSAFAADGEETFRAGEGVANDHSGNVSFVTRGGANAYGYGVGRQYETPLGLTLLAWDMPNSLSIVKGLRLNIGCGRFECTYGVDAGLFSKSGEFCGVAANLIGNFSERYADGLQCGLVNVAGSSAKGLQLGLFNRAQRLYGVQIGLINVNSSGIVFPFVNVGW